MSAIDLFAGPGGWDVACQRLGIDVLGIEWDRAACDTAIAAGHKRLWADVAALDPRAVADAYRWDGSGLIASPPCQDFSTAGKGAGEAGSHGQHVREPLRWVRDLQPAWTCWEQVATVLPIWRELALELRHIGYRVWIGVMNAADYGCPQDRRRAVLMASRTGPVQPPTPTHSAEPFGLFGDQEPHVTLADAIGLGPGWVNDTGQNSDDGRGGRVRYVRSCDRPAGTITGQSLGQWVLSRGDERRKLTFTEGCALQTFPRDYPFQGKREERDQQLGNAVPPRLAEHILRAITKQRVLDEQHLLGIRMRAASRIFGGAA